MSDTSATPPPPSITLCDIVTVLIRLLAIQFGFYSLNAIYMVSSRAHSGRNFHPEAPLVLDIFILLFCFLVAYWMWALAGWVARRVTKGHKAALSATQLTLLDLYSFGFFLIGLYFAVDNLGPSLTWLHYAITQSATEARLTPEQQTNFYTLFKYLMKLIIGLALVFNGRKLGAKLIRRDNKAPAATTSLAS